MSNKKIGVIVGIVVAVVLIGFGALFFFRKRNNYRLLKIYEFDGDGSVTRDKKGSITPYTNMVLESGDNIKLNTGKMSLMADEDKFIYLDEGTEIDLVAKGNSKNSKTSIELKSGGITNDIRNKLSNDSSYDINTPNSTMSVRGTMYYVYYYIVDGVRYTRVVVFEGKVATRLRYKDGTVSDEEVYVEKGKEVLIYEDGKTTDYVSDPTDIDFSTIPPTVIEVVQDAKDDGRDVALGLGNKVIVTFMYNGSVFGTQVIDKGDKATKPTLSPAASGSWQWDFDKEIEEDTTIEWK